MKKTNTKKLRVKVLRALDKSDSSVKEFQALADIEVHTYFRIMNEKNIKPITKRTIEGKIDGLLETL